MFNFDRAKNWKFMKFKENNSKKADLPVQNLEWKTQVSDLKRYSLKNNSGF